MGEKLNNESLVEAVESFRKLKQKRQEARAIYEAMGFSGTDTYAADRQWERFADQIGEQLFRIAMRVFQVPSTDISEIRLKAELLREYVSGVDDDIVDMGARILCDDLLSTGVSMRPHDQLATSAKK